MSTFAAIFTVVVEDNFWASRFNDDLALKVERYAVSSM